MNKYWVVGTSSKNYINEYISMLKNNVKTGNILSIDKSDIKEVKIICDNEIVNSGKSYIVIRQRIDVWTGMGFITKHSFGFKILFDYPKWEKLVEFSKLFILEETDNKKAIEYRFSTIINTLVSCGSLNEIDLKNLNIEQRRGHLTIEKIEKSISKYEVELSKDKNIINKMIERIKCV